MATRSDSVTGFYSPPTCAEHKNNEFTHFCEDHKTLLCDDCCRLSHRRCVMTALNVKSRDVNEGQLEEMMTRLSHTKTKVEKLQSSRDKDVTMVIQQAKQCITDVKEFRRRINETIDDLEKRARKVIDDAKKSREKHLQDLETTYSLILKQVNESIQDIDFCKSTGNKQIMFVGLKRASITSENNENIVSDLMAEDNSFHLTFQPSKEIEDLLHQVQELGHVSTTVQSADTSSNYNLLDMTVSSHQNVDIDTVYISGSTFLPSGDLVLCDFANNKLHLYSPTFTSKEIVDLPSWPHDLSTVSDTEVVVTLPREQKLQFVSVRAHLRLGQSLEVDRKCYGIDCHGDMMYVTCHGGSGNGEVLVLKDARVQRRVGLTQGRYKFKGPFFVRVSPTSGRLYVSDFYTNTITCLTQRGDVVYTYKHKDLSSPRDIHVDRQDNILVSGWGSHNIYRVDKHGTHHSILVSKSDGVDEPCCLSYRENDGALVVGMYNKPACKVFWLKK